jgi:LPS-assembly lipoprotein
MTDPDAWNAKAPPLPWRFARLALPALLLLCLAGCGFHPLYGKDSDDASVLDKLADIRVDPMRDRQGQLVRNALLIALSPQGEPERPRYHLGVTWVITQSQQALRTDDTATREIDNYAVTYRLYEGATPVLAGTFSEIFSFDFLINHYANVSSENDIMRRAAESMAAELRNRLAGYFAKAAEQARSAAR